MLRERRGNARALAGADTECRFGAVALERAEGERAERSYQIDQLAHGELDRRSKYPYSYL